MRKLMMVAGLLWMTACAHGPRVPAASIPAAAPAPATVSAPAVHEDFQTYCSHAACQHDVDIDLNRPDGGKYHRHFNLMPPSVQPQMVTIYPGQTVKAAASFKDGKFAGWKEAKDVAPDDIVLTFKLEQQTMGMFLSIHNDSQRLAKLTLLKVDLQSRSEDPEPTSSCPVIAGGGDSEMWPEPIFEIDVQSASIDPTDAGLCD